MAIFKKWAASFPLFLMYFEVAFADEVVSLVIMERIMEGMEEVLQKHNQKIETLEIQMNKIVSKVGLLETKDQEILGEIGKLERLIQTAGASSSSVPPTKILEKATSKMVAGTVTPPTLMSTQEKYGMLKWNSIKKTSQHLKMRSYSTKEDAETTTRIQDVNYIKTIQPTLKSIMTTSSPTELNKKIRLDHADGRSYPLKNKNGKCLAVSTTGDKIVSENGAKIIQSDCNPLEKGQMWKWEGKHLCNDWGKCLSVPKKTLGGKSNVFQWEYNSSEKYQKWAGLKKMGLLINMDSCLAIVGNSDVNGAEAKTEACNEKENGQVWSFVWK